MQKLPLSGILLVSDMDGTLVNRKFLIPVRNLEAIERFIEKGGLFTLATGRSTVSAGRYLDILKLNAPAIVMNGAAIYDYANEKYVFGEALPEICIEVVRRVIERFPDIGIEIYIGSDIYILSQNRLTDRHVVNEKFKYTLTDVDHLPPGSQKLLFAGENERLRELEAFIDGIETEGLHFVYTGNYFYEALLDGVSKGTALLRLESILGIKHENTVSIGDYYNDVELLQLAHRGIAVEDAPDEIKDVADLIVGKCDDGAVADVIEIIEKEHNC
jgi:Cof subfamily protein (haloacid dehalogenase superfamily)